MLQSERVITPPHLKRRASLDNLDLRSPKTPKSPAYPQLSPVDASIIAKLAEPIEETLRSNDLQPVKTTNVSNFFQKKEGERSEEEQRMIAESNAKPPPKPKNSREMSEAIVHVLEKYRSCTSDTPAGASWEARATFLDQAEAFVRHNEPVKMVLPAFPFKSPNKATKVLGVAPDAAEEYALAHLDGLAAAIEDVYSPGATIFIISDGLMYNDLLGVSSEEVWEYGQALRQLAEEKRLNHLKFLRLQSLTEAPVPETKEEYLAEADSSRSDISGRFLPSDFDVDAQIAEDQDTVLTFRGYMKFLELDLATEDSLKTRSRSQMKKLHAQIAKQMVSRGKAFAVAIQTRFPEFLRLSVHPSTQKNKMSMDLIPQDGRVHTPWHGALFRAIDGTVTCSHAANFDPATHEVIFDREGRPSYFRERSDLFAWPGMNLDFDYLYPTGMVISAHHPGESYSLKDVPMQKVRALATKCSPVVLRGFSNTTDDETYTGKAPELGKPVGWKFGLKTVVKDSRGKNDDPVTAIVTSSEPMPMHFDGFFFLVPKKQPDGSIRNESSQPGFQYFSSITPATPGSGYTLFASSSLLFKHLPHPHTVEDLRNLTWDCRHSSNWEEHMKNMPLVRKHPETGEDCLRYHEPWPQWKTQFTYNRISIENGPQWYIDLIDELLYDRRVTTWFTWEEGDILVSDNIKMLHTRTGFAGTEDRELWRIHVD